MYIYMYASISAIILEKPVNNKITDVCQQKVVPKALYPWLRTTKMNFEKLLGEQVFKKHTCNLSLNLL